MSRKERRTKLEIYYDILNAITNTSGGSVTPTRIQQNCNMSYDKFSNYLGELNKKGLINTSDFSITEKGKKLLEDYSKIKDFLHDMNMEYVTKEEEIKNV